MLRAHVKAASTASSKAACDLLRLESSGHPGLSILVNYCSLGRATPLSSGEQIHSMQRPGGPPGQCPVFTGEILSTIQCKLWGRGMGQCSSWAGGGSGSRIEKRINNLH